MNVSPEMNRREKPCPPMRAADPCVCMTPQDPRAGPGRCRGMLVSGCFRSAGHRLSCVCPRHEHRERPGQIPLRSLRRHPLDRHQGGGTFDDGCGRL